jgi:hypothetical protein
MKRVLRSLALGVAAVDLGVAAVVVVGAVVAAAVSAIAGNSQSLMWTGAAIVMMAAPFFATNLAHQKSSLSL